MGDDHIDRPIHARILVTRSGFDKVERQTSTIDRADLRYSSVPLIIAAMSGSAARRTVFLTDELHSQLKTRTPLELQSQLPNPIAAVQIRSAELLRVHIPLRLRVKHSLASRTENWTHFLLLTDDNGNRGIGELLTREYVTGETEDHGVACLTRLAQGMIGTAVNDPLDHLRGLWESTRGWEGRLGAMAAVDGALLDLASNSSALTIPELLRRKPLTSKGWLTYSGVYALTSGWKLSLLHFVYRTLFRMKELKVKGTGQLDRDLSYIQAIRRAFPYPIELRIDLNGALRPSDAPAYFQAMLSQNPPVLWIEQPFAKHDWQAASKHQRGYGEELTLCGDESICTMADLERAIEQGSFRGINLRIAKHGGLLKTLELYDRAVEAGLYVQLGSYVGESSVLAYGGLWFASLADRLRYREGCFGKLLIKWDVVVPSLTFGRGGRVALDRLPARGLVPKFDFQRLKRHSEPIS